MGETTDEIERQITNTRSQLGDNIIELKQRTRAVFDWRAQVEQHPGTMLAVAFGGGVILSALFNGLRGPHTVYSRQVSGDSPKSDHPAEFASSAESSARKNLHALGDALMGVALGHATGFMDGVLPGFRDEFERTRPRTKP